MNSDAQEAAWYAEQDRKFQDQVWPIATKTFAEALKEWAIGTDRSCAAAIANDFADNLELSEDRKVAFMRDCGFEPEEGRG